ncbi:uncharacterized protein LOC116657453 [Camelus ferus]|uniref:Uncharacterized protein LOC116657453 n=1 Tax=Camelus ferus TaxID=419612 RepID=A0A8B8RBS3_CAMFR|nr:uncharacterized protein LOC116657453 [Camelus ferus]
MQVSLSPNKLFQVSGASVFLNGVTIYAGHFNRGGQTLSQSCFGSHHQDPHTAVKFPSGGQMYFLLLRKTSIRREGPSISGGFGDGGILRGGVSSIVAPDSSSSAPISRFPLPGTQSARPSAPPASNPCPPRLCSRPETLQTLDGLGVVPGPLNSRIGDPEEPLCGSCWFRVQETQGWLDAAADAPEQAERKGRGLGAGRGGALFLPATAWSALLSALLRSPGLRRCSRRPSGLWGFVAPEVRERLEASEPRGRLRPAVGVNHIGCLRY